MEPSTSQLQAPDTAARVAIRQRPSIHVDPYEPPSPPTWVQFWHPANNLTFLRLPALDYCPPTFGIHYGTAIAACQILACNEKGYLSTSRDPHADGRINVDLDSVISSGKYYYHLSSPKAEALYPICCEFSCWKFPHKNLPPAWKNELPDRTTAVWPSNWSAISEKIKARDTQCLISESKDSLTTSRVVAKIDETWLIQNDMDVYLTDGRSLSQSPRNLFTLRLDLHLGQFDQAGFVIVPKLGQLVVHFLQPAYQSAQQYHNVQFDHKNTLSHEALYARFAWALMKIVKSSLADVKGFRFLTASGTDGGGDDSDGDEDGGGGESGSSGGDEGSGHSGGGGGRRSRNGRGRGGRGSGGNKGGGRGRGGVKRKRNDENEDDESHYGTGATSGPGNDWRSGNYVTSDACPREAGSQLLLDSEAREFEEDMKKAARTLPFFVDPNGKADARHYENILWYPGRAIVERRKQAYFDAHPQIRAHSDQLLPDDYDSSGDEDLHQRKGTNLAII